MLRVTVEISKRTIAAAKRAVREYAKEDGIPISDCRSAFKTLEGLDDDWFLVFDAIGTRPPRFFQENNCDPTMPVLYNHAMAMALPGPKKRRLKAVAVK